MDFERQKPVTDAYRKNWDYVFSRTLGITTAQFESSDFWRDNDGASYSNGCPILSEAENGN